MAPELINRRAFLQGTTALLSLRFFMQAKRKVTLT